MSFLPHISSGLRNCLTISSRATRAEFWSLWGLHVGALAVGYGVLMLSGNPLIGLRAFALGLLIYVLTLPFSFTAAIRRFHDAGQSAKSGAALYLLIFACLALAAWLYLPMLRVDAHLANVHSDMSSTSDTALYAYLSPGVTFGTAAHKVLGALIFVYAILPLTLIAALSFAFIILPLARRSEPGTNAWGPNPHEVAL